MQSVISLLRPLRSVRTMNAGSGRKIFLLIKNVSLTVVFSVLFSLIALTGLLMLRKEDRSGLRK